MKAKVVSTGNYWLKYYDTWRNKSRAISIAELRAAVHKGSLEYIGTCENTVDKLTPADLVQYTYRSNFRDAGMGSVILYHMSNDINTEFGISGHLVKS